MSKRPHSRRLLRSAAVLLLVLLLAADLFGANYLINFAIRRSSAAGAKAAPAPITSSETQDEVHAVSAQLKEKTKLWLEQTSSELLTISSTDGLKLVGEYFVTTPESHRWTLLVHGYTCNRGTMYNYAYLWAQRGFNLLIPDLRGHGDSEGDFIGMGWPDRNDLLLWIDMILELDPDAEILLHGVSMGAASVMMVSGETLPSNVRVIIEDCGYTSVWDIFEDELNVLFHLPAFPLLHTADLLSRWRAGYGFRQASALEQIRNTTVPVFFIHGDQDNFVHSDMLPILYDACPTDKDYMIVEGAGHGQSLYKDPDGYFERILQFAEPYLT